MLYKFGMQGNEEREFERELVVAGAGNICQLAVDDSSEVSDPSKGDLYVADLTAGKVFRYE